MKRDTSKLEGRIKEAIATLESLLAPAQVRGRGTAISELLMRAEMSSDIDGYSTGGGIERTSGGSVGNPTASTVLAREGDVCPACKQGQITLKDGKQVTCRRCNGSGRRWADPVADAVNEIEYRLSILVRSAKAIDRHRSLIASSAKPSGREQSLQGECMACRDMVTGIGEDRLRAGLDNKCYLSMTSWKLRNPDTQSDPGGHYRKFIKWRQDGLAERERKEAEVKPS